MRYSRLKSLGAIEVEPLRYSQNRPKMSGYMYAGSARLSYRTMLFDFELWYHGGDSITKEEVESKISLKSIFFEGKWYDICWHTIMTENEIYLHKEGWFRNPLASLMRSLQCNYNIDRTPQEAINPAEMLLMGFIKII